MSILRIEYRFSGEVWQYQGPNGWYFVSLPIKLSNEIRETFRDQEQGWGRLTAAAKVGKTEWKTAIWFDSKAKTYSLPLKSDVREKEKIEKGTKIKVTIFI